MSAGRPTQWQATDMTLRALYGLGEPATAAAPSSGNPCAAVLSHDTFRARFAGVPGDTYVCGPVMLCYLGLARPTVERRLADAFGNGGPLWRSALTRHPRHAPPGPALQRSRYRWSFITQELDPLVGTDRQRARLRRIEEAGLRTRGRPSRRPPSLRLEDLARLVTWVVDGQGRIVCALGQAHVAADDFIAVMNADGRLESLSPVAALARAWTTTAARAPWEDVIRDVLTRQTDAILDAVFEGTVETERVQVETHIEQGGHVQLMRWGFDRR